MERKQYFILRFLVTEYEKDNAINTVNNIVTNNVKENELGRIKKIGVFN